MFHLEILSKCHFRCCLFASAYVLYFVEVKSRSVSCVQLFVVPWTIACQASLSAGFSRQGHRSGSPCPSLGDLPDPGIKPRSPASQADSLQFELPGKPLLCELIVNTGDSKKKKYWRLSFSFQNLLVVLIKEKRKHFVFLCHLLGDFLKTVF